jgi:hypothetical protein
VARPAEISDAVAAAFTDRNNVIQLFVENRKLAKIAASLLANQESMKVTLRYYENAVLRLKHSPSTTCFCSGCRICFYASSDPFLEQLWMRESPSQ